MSKIIWTNHALQRIKDRKISQGQIQQTIISPDSTINNPDGSTEFAREYGQQKVFVVTRKNDKGEIIILSCWINPPTVGSKDHKKKMYYKKQKNSKGLKKFWYTFLNQLGL